VPIPTRLTDLLGGASNRHRVTQLTGRGRRAAGPGAAT
jgi:hypothetical protein